MPGICRTALECAFTEAARIRLHRAGRPEHEVAAAVEGALKLMELAALGLFGVMSRTGDVYRKLRELCGPNAVGVLKQCQDGAHDGTPMPDPHRFVGEIAAIAQVVRKP